jgi:hypothetical protein
MRKILAERSQKTQSFQWPVSAPSPRIDQRDRHHARFDASSASTPSVWPMGNSHEECVLAERGRLTVS